MVTLLLHPSVASKDIVASLNNNIINMEGVSLGLCSVLSNIVEDVLGCIELLFLFLFLFR